ncbi:hypothetical protein C2845_PM17G07980 [Panicum miliaceum]|uniref:Uncharacterized protein n=1 Tax=Panicum miliaceum TaxID=4540 RepID=A0A3L6Q1Q7_PANMI|nr:hypothetical protein C2845_PM17G07980 [Panicum miliaceum]
MANNSIVPFVGSTSTFALEGEPTPAEHVATTPLAVLPAPTTKEGPRGASRGSTDPPSSPSRPPSVQRFVKTSGAKVGRGGHSNNTQRPTTGALRPKGIGKKLFADLLSPLPLEKGQQYVYSITTKSGNVASHNYTTTGTYTPDSLPAHEHVVGIRTPGGGYGKGIMASLSPKRKWDESVDSFPRASKVRRHISPPPITRPGGHYEIVDDKVLKGPTIAQLLRNIIEMSKEHKKLSDQVAVLTLELKSVKDDYDTLRRGLCSKINTLAKTIGKNNA